MTIDTIKTLLDADILYGSKYLEHEVNYAFSSDMMSDVLAFATDHSALITGLCNSAGRSDRRDARYRLHHICEK